jgi:hypothetical protein
MKLDRFSISKFLIAAQEEVGGLVYLVAMWTPAYKKPHPLGWGQINMCNGSKTPSNRL